MPLRVGDPLERLAAVGGAPDPARAAGERARRARVDRPVRALAEILFEPDPVDTADGGFPERRGGRAGPGGLRSRRGGAGGDSGGSGHRQHGEQHGGREDQAAVSEHAGSLREAGGPREGDAGAHNDRPRCSPCTTPIR